jgi:hypothetical protein
MSSFFLLLSSSSLIIGSCDFISSMNLHVWLDVMLEAKEDRMERIAMVCKFIEEMKSHEPIISEDDDSNKKKELIPSWD